MLEFELSNIKQWNHTNADNFEFSEGVDKSPDLLLYRAGRVGPRDIGFRITSDKRWVSNKRRGLEAMELSEYQQYTIVTDVVSTRTVLVLIQTIPNIPCSVSLTHQVR